MTRAETIARKLQAMWPDPATREQVVAVLNTYGQESHEGEFRKDPSPEGRRRLEELQQADGRQYEDWLEE